MECARVKARDHVLNFLQKARAAGKEVSYEWSFTCNVYAQILQSEFHLFFEGNPRRAFGKNILFPWVQILGVDCMKKKLKESFNASVQIMIQKWEEKFKSKCDSSPLHMICQIAKLLQ